MVGLVNLIRELYESHGEARAELLLREASKQEDPHSMLIHFLRGQPADGSSDDDRAPRVDCVENE
jgi:hypothetical protein